MKTHALFVLACGAAALAGCADRDPIWDTGATPAAVLGLSDAAVIVDANADRAIGPVGEP